MPPREPKPFSAEFRMPVDASEWKGRLELSNFVNTYYQYRDLSDCCRSGRVLIVGPGQGLEVAIFKWRGYEVVTADVEPTFDPDVICSVHDLSAFASASFDVVIASHVLEHLPPDLLDTAISEIARVGRFALVYLPIRGRKFRMRIQPGFGALDWNFGFDVFNYFERPLSTVRKFMAGQHYWEIGVRGYRVREVQRRLQQHFTVRRSYRNPDWPISWNFVLESKHHAVRTEPGAGRDKP